METVKDILSMFCLALGAGTYLFLPIVSTSLTGVGFLKLACAIAISSLGIVFGLEISSAAYTSSIFTLVIMILMGIQYFIHEDEKSTGMWAFFYGTIILVLAKYFFIFGHQPMELTYQLSILLFLGLTNYLMILGHYYLVVPKLTTRPLIIGSYFFWFVLAGKVALMVWGYFKFNEFFEEGTSLGMGYLFNQILFWMRLLWGLLAAAAMNFMAYKCSKIDSTQSATGILYIMLFFVIVGELISLYFARGLGVLGI